MEIKKGNVVDALLNNEVDYIMHVCNAQGVMGSGVAKEIKERVPNAYKSYKNLHEFGSISECDGVINLVAQEYYGGTKRTPTLW